MCLVDPELLRNSERNRSGSFSKGSLTLGISGSTFPSSSSPSLSLSLSFPLWHGGKRERSARAAAARVTRWSTLGTLPFPLASRHGSRSERNTCRRGEREGCRNRGGGGEACLVSARSSVIRERNSGLFARGVGPGWLRPPLEPRSCLPRGVPPVSYLRNSCRRPLPPLRKKTVCPSPRFPWFLTGRRTLRLLCVRRGILGSRVDLYRRLGRSSARRLVPQTVTLRRVCQQPG